MKQIILPVTVHLNTRLPLALLPPDRADAPTGRGPEPHPCQGWGTCGGGGKCQHKKKQPRPHPRQGLPPVPQSAAAGT